MSVQQYFNEVEAVCQVLSEHIASVPETEFINAESDSWVAEQYETFTAIWQAVELLSRAYAVLLPMIQAEQAKVALLLPDVVEKKATLYGPNGEAL